MWPTSWNTDKSKLVFVTKLSVCIWPRSWVMILKACWSQTEDLTVQKTSVRIHCKYGLSKNLNLRRWKLSETKSDWLTSVCSPVVVRPSNANWKGHKEGSFKVGSITRLSCENGKFTKMSRSWSVSPLTAVLRSWGMSTMSTDWEISWN